MVKYYEQRIGATLHGYRMVADICHIIMARDSCEQLTRTTSASLQNQ